MGVVLYVVVMQHVDYETIHVLKAHRAGTTLSANPMVFGIR
jgi:hypothetical protein